MNKNTLIFISILSCICSSTLTFAQKPLQSKNNLPKAFKDIDSLDKQFSKYYFIGDSFGIYRMYAKNASLNGLKGTDILTYWNKGIQNSIKDDTRDLTFKTASIFSEEEFLIELGSYEIKNSKGILKNTGKYLVVWKQEGGNWKLYRDIGL